jgi:predicted kinase
MKSLSLSQPHAIIMVGLPGSGKTFFAKKFADTFSAPYVSHEAILSIVPVEKAALDQIINYQLDELLKTRHSVVIEGSANTRAERTELAKKLRTVGYQPMFVWVQTDPETAKARSLKTKQRGEEEHEHLVRRFSAPHPTEKPIVISGKHTYATQAKIILKRLSGPRAEISTHSSPPVRSLTDIRRSR